MYDSSGAQGGAWLTIDKKYGRYKTYGLSGVRNDTWYPVVDDNAAYENGLDVQKLCDYAVTASRTTKKAISKVYEWTGVWGAGAAGMGGGYLLTSGSDDVMWLNKLFAALGVIALSKMVDRLEKKFKEYKREKVTAKVNQKYFSFMKELMKSDLDIDGKINFRYEIGVDDFARKLEKRNGYKASELNAELDKMESCLKRYIETRKSNHGNNHAKYPHEDGACIDDKKVA